MRFSICNEIFEGWDIDRVTAHIAELGYDAVEIAPFTSHAHVHAISSQERRRIREAVRGNGLTVSGIHWLLAKTEGLHVTHPDADVRRRTSAYLVQLVEFCHDIGGEHLIFGSPLQRNIPAGTTPEAACKRALEVFGKAVERAAEFGIIICFEPLAPIETNFINTAADAISLTRRMDCASFKIILDVKAMSSETRPIPEIIRSSWPDFAYFHANDTNLKGPGFGDTDYAPIVKALGEVGYDGYVSVEVFRFDEGPKAIAQGSIEYLKRVFGDE